MTRKASWEYHAPTRVIFGPGSLARLGDFVVGRALLVTTPGMTTRGVTDRIRRQLADVELVIHDAVASNPTLAEISAAHGALNSEGIDSIVAVGGGSTIDTAKVLSLLLAGGDLADALAGAETSARPLPLVAIPTTAGTGSEVTPFATLWDEKTRRKRSIETPKLHPAIALVDPELAVTLAWEATLGPGLDAFIQCLEAIWNRHATPVTSALAIRGVQLAPPALRRLSEQPASIEARRDMAEVALLSGLAIGQTHTALVHSMSYPLTAHYGIPHGLACTLLLPAVLTYNIEADDGRLHWLAEQIGLNSADELTTSVLALLRDLGVASAIKAHLPMTDSITRLAPEMLTPGRADNNMRPARADDVRTILAQAMDWLERGYAS